MAVQDVYYMCPKLNEKLEIAQKFILATNLAVPKATQ